MPRLFNRRRRDRKCLWVFWIITFIHQAMPILTIDYDTKHRKSRKPYTPACCDPKEDKSGKERVDHGSFVPLFFVAHGDKALEGKAETKELHLKAKVVRLSFCGLSEKTHYEYGMAIQDVILASGKRVVFIASGDLSHRLKKDGPYGLAPRAQTFDKEIVSALAAGDFSGFSTFSDDLLDEVAECGLRSLNILGGVLDGADYEPELLSYEDTWRRLRSGWFRHILVI